MQSLSLWVSNIDLFTAISKGELLRDRVFRGGKPLFYPIIIIYDTSNKSR